MRSDAIRPVEVLLVEDNPGDVMLTTEAFEDAKVAVNLTALMNGQEAIDHLLACPDDELPDLVLLDLNLPGVNGHEVLKAIRHTERLRHLPTIIMTTSRSEADVSAAYREMASSYIAKPIDPDEFLRAVKGLEDYWLTIVELPGRRG